MRTTGVVKLYLHVFVCCKLEQDLIPIGVLLKHDSESLVKRWLIFALNALLFRKYDLKTDSEIVK
jgi:hypothetical protein